MPRCCVISKLGPPARVDKQPRNRSACLFISTQVMKALATSHAVYCGSGHGRPSHLMPAEQRRPPPPSGSTDRRMTRLKCVFGISVEILVMLVRCWLTNPHMPELARTAARVPGEGYAFYGYDGRRACRG